MLRIQRFAACFSLSLLLGTPAAYAARVKDVGSNPIMVRAAFDDSAEAIRQRSGSGDPDEGIRKSFLCQGCHGTEGVSDNALIPNLAGQYANYIAKQVRNYQAGTRSHQIMNAMAGTVDSDTDLADIAAYFASQLKMEGDNSPGNALGEGIFLHGDLSRKLLACIICHGVHGKGVGPGTSMYPVLGGQQEEYLLKELKAFKSGARTNSPGGIMSNIAKKLTEEEIEELADYLSAQ